MQIEVLVSCHVNSIRIFCAILQNIMCILNCIFSGQKKKKLFGSLADTGKHFGSWVIFGADFVDIKERLDHLRGAGWKSDSLNMVFDDGEYEMELVIGNSVWKNREWT